MGKAVDPAFVCLNRKDMTACVVYHCGWWTYQDYSLDTIVNKIGG